MVHAGILRFGALSRCGQKGIVFVALLVTGILGAMIGPFVLNMIGVRNWAARGLAMGTASHGIGTARALQMHELAGAFSGLAMGLNAVVTVILVPVIWKLVFG